MFKRVALEFNDDIRWRWQAEEYQFGRKPLHIFYLHENIQIFFKRLLKLRKQIYFSKIIK
jgi:hypothetical protein